MPIDSLEKSPIITEKHVGNGWDPISSLAERSEAVRSAISRNDWDKLRELSLLPGGFGVKGRREAWVYLLHATPNVQIPSLQEIKASPKKERAHSKTKNVIPSDPDELKPPASLDSSENEEDEKPKPHPDERQVSLDTDRSFVMYPIEDQLRKNNRKSQLYNLITMVLRKRRKLSYFQGYHDVISVLQLTFLDTSSGTDEPLPSLLLVSCAEKISLHRLRDSMGSGLEPLMGFLRIMKRLLRAADLEFSKIVETSSPLPYFALSNLLTLLSHDIPTLPLIQRVFDFLLCRPPIYVIYLTVALVLSRKTQIQKFETEGEEGMLHSALAQLPDLIPDGEEESERPKNEPSPPPPFRDRYSDLDEEILAPLSQDVLELPQPRPLNVERSDTSQKETHPDIKHELPVVHSAEEGPMTTTRTDPAQQQNSSPITPHDAPDTTTSRSTSASLATIDTSFVTPNPVEIMSPDSAITTVETKLASTPPVEKPPSLASPPPPLHQASYHQGIPISSIFKQAVQLYALYPPTHPSINAGEIMGPNSVIHTWSERDYSPIPKKAPKRRAPMKEKPPAISAPIRTLPSDDKAENMVLDTSSVVYPYDPSEEYDLEEEEQSPPSSAVSKRKRKQFHVAMDRLTVLAAGVAVVVGVGVAVYSTSGRSGATNDMLRLASNYAQSVDWQNVLSGWVGGIVLGV